jgi:acetyl esterase/lipase
MQHTEGMGLGRCTSALAVAGALVLAGCGMEVRESLRPEALTTVVAGAEAGATATRLAFAAQRYRTEIFPTVARYDNGSGDPVYATLPDLVTGAPAALSMSVYTPLNDSAPTRPLIVWIHGGAFLNGTRGQMASVAQAYARLGYVTATIDYRLDPGNHCLEVQAGLYVGAQLVAERARCERAILAARDDAAVAIAFLRANAASYRIDTTRVAVGGASAGAITAVHVGQTLNVPGNPAPDASRVSVVLAMSGCNYVAGSIDAADAPVAMLASGGDPLVPYACAVGVVDTAAAGGIPVWRNFYPEENLHAQALYAAHRDEVDRGWRLFLIDTMHLG